MALSTKIGLLTLGILLLGSITVVNAQNGPSDYESPTTSTLNSVYILSNVTATADTALIDVDAWAVGDGGTILRWDGNAWNESESPTEDNLYAVIMINASSGWAVGGTSDRGTILNYDNGNWSVWNNITSFTANASEVTDTQVNGTLYGIDMDINGASGWIVGADGNMLFWDGTVWISANMEDITMTLRSVAMIHGGTQDAWAVGDNGTILRFDGTTWNIGNSMTTATLRYVIITNATSGWAVGGDGDNGIILNWTTTGWSVWDRINFGGPVNATTGYVTDKINSTLNAMTMATDNSAWAVGNDGMVLYWDGMEWMGMAQSTSEDLKGVSMIHGVVSTVDNAWAVGGGGEILAWTGTEWIPEIPAFAIAPVLFGAFLFVLLLRKTKHTRKLPIVPP